MFASPPAPVAATSAATDELGQTIASLRDRGFLALTGAGMSTDSGIPDYRGPGSVARSPMTYQEFVSGPDAQQRYWARGFVGWSRMGTARPNAGHAALAGLEATGTCTAVLTQNVDGLHERAGSRRLVALHGRIADVVCLGCGSRTSRTAVQHRMAAANPGWLDRHAAAPVRPDGDVETDDTRGFVVPRCLECRGVLKPDVVYFGENVPKDRVQRCYDLLDEAGDAGAALLVLGSSLTVMSGYRFVLRATQLGRPVAIVNLGPTRGDGYATVRVDAPLGRALAAVNTRVRLAGRVASRAGSEIPSSAAAMAVPSSP
jgi:NAD-dependent SIR2 family protein deacetylase